MTRHLATLKESYLLPLFTRPCLNFIALTFRALGRNHIAPTPSAAIAMLCDKKSSRIPLVRSSSEMSVRCTGHTPKSILCPAVLAMQDSPPDASSSFRSSNIKTRTCATLWAGGGGEGEEEGGRRVGRRVGERGKDENEVVEMVRLD